jgi:hypothetical protein
MTTAGDAPVATDMRPTSSSEPRLGKRTRLLSRDLAMRKEISFSPHHAEDGEVPTRQFNVKKQMYQHIITVGSNGFLFKATEAMVFAGTLGMAFCRP